MSPGDENDYELVNYVGVRDYVVRRDQSTVSLEVTEWAESTIEEVLEGTDVHVSRELLVHIPIATC